MIVDIQAIKTKISCVDIARKAGLPINRAGDRCKSPFHEGTTNTSFVVFDNFWHSFSDDKGGDQIDLWAALYEKGDRGKAIKALARMVGVTAPVNEEWVKQTQACCNKAAFFHAQLRPEDLDYLHKRRLTDDTIKRRLLGYFDGCIIIPYWKNGYVYDYTTRKYEGEPRYKRSGEGLDKAPWGQHTLNREGPVWLVEGTFDAITLDQEGRAVLQTTKPEIDMLRAFPGVILAYDNDEAGLKYTRKVALMLYSARIPFQVAEFKGKDLADYYASGREIDHINLKDGLQTIIASFQEIDEFRRFARTAARYCDPLRISDLIGSAVQFSEKERKLIERIATYPPSESEMSDEVADSNTIIYLENVGYYVWSGTIWKKVSDTYVKALIDKAYGKFFTTNQRCNAVLNLLKSRVLVDTVFDRKPVLTFINGTLELDTGKFREARPGDYCSICMSYPYDPEAQADKWEKFINEIADDDPMREATLQEIAGYVLFPDCRHQKMFALIGDGGNGKSVYLEILQKLFGDENCSNVDPQGMTEAFQCIYIKDSLLNVGSEIDSDFSKAEKVLKKVAAGEEVTACYKGMNFVKFYPRCKLLYACNEMPRAAVIKGIDRRLVFVKFPCQFVEIPNPKNRLQKKRNLNIIPELLEEMSGIFNWAYTGYKTLMAVSHFTEPREQEEYMKQFKEISNPMMVFCEEHLFEGGLTKDEIYIKYSTWCRDTGHKANTRETFYRKFREIMGKRIIKEDRRTLNGKQTLMMWFGQSE